MAFLVWATVADFTPTTEFLALLTAGATNFRPTDSHHTSFYPCVIANRPCVIADRTGVSVGSKRWLGAVAETLGCGEQRRRVRVILFERGLNDPKLGNRCEMHARGSDWFASMSYSRGLGVRCVAGWLLVLLMMTLVGGGPINLTPGGACSPRDSGCCARAGVAADPPRCVSGGLLGTPRADRQHSTAVGVEWGENELAGQRSGVSSGADNPDARFSGGEGLEDGSTSDTRRTGLEEVCGDVACVKACVKTEFVDHDPSEFSEVCDSTLSGIQLGRMLASRQNLLGILETHKQYVCKCIARATVQCEACARLVQSRVRVSFGTQGGSLGSWRASGGYPPRTQSFSVFKYGRREAFIKAVVARIMFLDDEIAQTAKDAGCGKVIPCANPAPWSRSRRHCHACAARRPHENEFVGLNPSSLAKAGMRCSEELKPSVICVGWRVESGHKPTSKTFPAKTKNVGLAYGAANSFIQEIMSRQCTRVEACGPVRLIKLLHIRAWLCRAKSFHFAPNLASAQRAYQKARSQVPTTTTENNGEPTITERNTLPPGW